MPSLHVREQKPPMKLSRKAQGFYYRLEKRSSVQHRTSHYAETTESPTPSTSRGKTTNFPGHCGAPFGQSTASRPNGIGLRWASSLYAWYKSLSSADRVNCFICSTILPLKGVERTPASLTIKWTGWSIPNLVNAGRPSDTETILKGRISVPAPKVQSAMIISTCFDTEQSKVYRLNAVPTEPWYLQTISLWISEALFCTSQISNEQSLLTLRDHTRTCFPTVPPDLLRDSIIRPSNALLSY